MSIKTTSLLFLVVSFFLTAFSETSYSNNLQNSNVDCPEPIDLQISDAGANSVELTWTEQGTATSWEIEWGKYPFLQNNTEKIENIANTSYTIDGITSNEYYAFTVKSVCADNEFSEGTEGFHSKCNEQEGLPYFTDFSDTPPSNIPPCWDATGDSGWQGDGWEAALVGNNTQQSYFLFSTGVTSGGSPKSAYAMLPDFGGVAISNLAIEFNALVDDWLQEDCELQIGVWTDQNTFIEYETISISPGQNITRTIYFEEYSGDPGRIGFYHYNENTSQANIRLYDVELYELAECSEVYNIDAENKQQTSASIIWDSPLAAESWFFKYGLEGFDPENEGSLIEISNYSNIDLMGLQPLTGYDVYIQTICGGLNSEWEGPYTFNTLCEDISITPSNFSQGDEVVINDQSVQLDFDIQFTCFPQEIYPVLINTENQTTYWLDEIQYNGSTGTFSTNIPVVVSSGEYLLAFEYRLESENSSTETLFNIDIVNSSDAFIDITETGQDSYIVTNYGLRYNWNSFDVESVNLYFSSDDQENWTLMQENISSSDGSNFSSNYSFFNESHDGMLVYLKIESGADPAINDVFGPYTVLEEEPITLVSPTSNIDVVKGDEIDVVFNCLAGGVVWYRLISTASSNYFEEEEINAAAGENQKTISTTNLEIGTTYNFGFGWNRYFSGSDFSFEFTVVDNTSVAIGNKPILNRDLSVYPNPVDDFLYINASNVSENSTINIYCISGLKVLENELSSQPVDVSNLKPGLYLIVVGDKTVRFIKR